MCCHKVAGELQFCFMNSVHQLAFYIKNYIITSEIFIVYFNIRNLILKYMPVFMKIASFLGSVYDMYL